MKKILIVIILIILSACEGNASKDYGEYSWGMTMDKVLKVEENHGNTIAKKNENKEKGIQVYYADQVINDKHAGIRYTFSRQIENRPSIVEGSPKILQFNDYILTEVYIQFTDYYNNGKNGKDWDVDSVYKPLEEKYGKPVSGESSDLYWDTKRSLILLQNYSVITYIATDEALKKFSIKGNKEL